VRVGGGAWLSVAVWGVTPSGFAATMGASLWIVMGGIVRGGLRERLRGRCGDSRPHYDLMRVTVMLSYSEVALIVGQKFQT